MASDLNIFIDNTRLNIRVGIIMRYHDQFIIEVSKLGRNSVIPGGRVKINERTDDAIVREISEEMGFNLDKDRVKRKTHFENFFTCLDVECHEFFFLFEYILNDTEYELLQSLNDNQDNKDNYFKFLPKTEFDGYNLLPLDLHEIIRN